MLISLTAEIYSQENNVVWRKGILMAEKKNILTYEGLKQLEDELQELKVNKRKQVAQKIKEAREQGDLSENAEYDAAKDEQRDIEARIEEIDKILKNAEVVVEDEVDVNTINIGCLVRILDMEYDDYTVMRFGVLNSKDTYTNMKELQKIVDIMEIYMQTSESNKNADMSELSMITNIIEIFKEDIAKSKSHPNDYFKIKFKEI